MIIHVYRFQNNLYIIVLDVDETTSKHILTAQLMH